MSCSRGDSTLCVVSKNLPERDKELAKLNERLKKISVELK